MRSTRARSPSLVAVGLVVLGSVAACGRDRDGPAPSTTEAAPTARAQGPLESRLTAMAGCEPAACEREVTSWKLDRVGWDALVVDPYRGVEPALYYSRAFEAAVPALAAQLRAGGGVAIRRHFAGDAKNTPGQARARWALPVQYPSFVAEIGGVPLDAVFDVDRAGRVHAIVGVDTILHRFADRLDPGCAELLDRARDGRCFEVAWVIAEAAMRGERDRFDRACALAAGLCLDDRGMRSP